MKTSDKIDNLVKAILAVTYQGVGVEAIPWAVKSDLRKALQALLDEFITKLPTPPKEVEYENRTPYIIEPVSTCKFVKESPEKSYKFVVIFGETEYCYDDQFIKHDGKRVLAVLDENPLLPKNPVPEGFVRCDIPVGSLVVPPGMEKEWAEKVLATQSILDKVKPYMHQFNKKMVKANQENYPDDFNLYEHLAGKPIQHHKFPEPNPNHLTVIRAEAQVVANIPKSVIVTSRDIWKPGDKFFPIQGGGTGYFVIDSHPNPNGKEFEYWIEGAYTIGENQIWGKEGNYYKVPDEKTSPHMHGFPPVMYSPDGVKVNRASDYGMYTNFMGDKKDIPCLTHYSKLIKEGFTEHKPMRSRENIEQFLGTLKEPSFMSYVSGIERGWIQALKWVLNEE